MAPDKPIPYGRQSVSEADIQAVIKVLRSDFLTQGPVIPRFEQAVAEACGARYAVAVSNATAGLHIACLAAGLGPGDWLWTSPNTFVASANCARYCGAQVDFVDIDPRTYNLSVTALTEKLAVAQRENRLPKIVVPVHFAGQSCEMRRMRELADTYGFLLIEDAAHAIGGSYQGQKIGSGAFSDMTIFSFHPVKIITTGEGGMVLTNQADLAERLQRLRTHGITRDPAHMHGVPEGPWVYEQIELGLNYRITDIQAALGLSQLTRLDTFVRQRRALAKRYDALLADLPVVLPWQHPETESAWHLYVIQLSSHNRAQVFEAMRARGIGVNVHYIPVHTQPDYQRLGFQAGAFPVAEAYYRQAITLPLFADLTETDQDRVVACLRESLEISAPLVST